MRKRWHGALLVFAVTSSVVLATSKHSSQFSDDDDAVLWSWGVSIAGAEFGSHEASFSNQNPGVYDQDYTYPGSETIAPLAQHGIRLMRLPIQWERLQPKLGRGFSKAEIARLDKTISMVGDAGCRVILDLHNYGRYRMVIDSADGNPKRIDAVIDQNRGGTVHLSRDHLADLWTRLAIRYRRNPAVIAYGLMNEPHDMGNSQWKLISQTAVDAIREVDDATWILVSGNDWATSERFPQVNGLDAWIRDDTGKTAYEAHCYLDHDASGKYRMSFEEELRLDPNLPKRSMTRLRPFADWCDRNGVFGFVGEFGVPANDPHWNRLLSEMMNQMHELDLSGCCWAAGPWWGDYAMSIQIDDQQTDIPRSLQVLMQAL